MKNISLRVTDDEYAAMLALSKYEHMPLAGMVRKLLLDTARERGFPTGAPAPKAAKATAAQPDSPRWPKQVRQTPELLAKIDTIKAGPLDSYFPENRCWAPAANPRGVIPLPMQAENVGAPQAELIPSPRLHVQHAVMHIVGLNKLGLTRSDIAALYGLSVAQIEDIFDRRVREGAVEGRSIRTRADWHNEADRTRWDIIDAEETQRRLAATPLFAGTHIFDATPDTQTHDTHAQPGDGSDYPNLFGDDDDPLPADADTDESSVVATIIAPASPQDGPLGY